jgi:hypothetical protein
MKIPLSQITVRCQECGETASGDDLNQDVVRYHKPSGSSIRLPADGLEPGEVQLLGGIPLLCELCQEDKEEND